MTSVPSFWSSFLVWTAAEVAAIALLATLAQWFVRAPAGRKIIWRAALLVTLLTLAAESSGLSSGAGQWLRHQVAPTTAAARVMTVSVTSDPASLAELSVKPVVTQPTPWQLTPEPAPVWWPLWIWLAGMGLAVGYHAMGGLLILRLKRRMQPVVEAGLVARMNEIAARLGLKTRVQLYESRAAPGPFTYGWWRPAICLPPDFTGDFNSMQQDAILAHELSHIAGRDFLWQRLSNGLAGLLWWHPMVWWMRHQLATASEHAADEASLVVPNGSEALAESLLALGRKMSRGWQPVLLGVEGAGFRSTLAKRVQRLWSLRGQRFGADRRRFMAPVIAGGVLALCSLTLFAAILPRDIGANGAWRNSLIAMAAETLKSPPTPPAAAPPKPMNFKDPSRMLMVRAAPNDLLAVQSDLLPSQKMPPQIMIEMRICDVPSDLLKPGELEKLLGIKLTNAVANTGVIQSSPTNAAASTLIGALTAEQTQQVLRLLAKRSGVDILSAPRLTTLSGRQAQVKIVDIKQIVTDLKPKAATNSPTVNKQSVEVADDVVPVIEPFECGVFVDITPTVLPDGESIRLAVMPGIREFLGYDDVQDTREPFPRLRTQPLPRFRVRQSSCSADLLDGQTIVIAGGADFEEVINRGGSEVHPPKVKPAKSLLIFVTPRLLDESGNPSNR